MGSTPPKTKPKARRRRVLTTVALAVPVLAVGLWIAVHKIPWLGPLVANTLRAVVGTDNVAKLEDFAYGVEDRFNRWYRKNDKPKAYWEVPAEEPKSIPVATADAPPPVPELSLIHISEPTRPY